MMNYRLQWQKSKWKYQHTEMIEQRNTSIQHKRLWIDGYYSTTFESDIEIHKILLAFLFTYLLTYKMLFAKS